MLADNVTTGANGIVNETGLSTTSFAPGSALPDGTILWRVQASDGTNVSPFTSDSTFHIDTLPPGAVTLSGTVPTGLNLVNGAVAISSSGDLSSVYSKEKAVDGDLGTFWASTPRATMQTEQITVDLGTTNTVGRVRLRSRSDSVGAFPKDFEIQVSDDNVSFATVHSESDFVASGATWYAFDFASISTRYIRIRVTESVLWGASFAVHIAEIEAYTTGSIEGTIELTWSAPGDDPGVGAATLYDFRYAVGSVIDFATAIQAVSEPTPAAFGTPESFTVSGLQGETTHTFATRSMDDAGNLSPVSAPFVLATVGTPPGAVSDLQANNPGLNTMELFWTAPFEDGASGLSVTAYDVRYSTSPITEANFDSATAATGEPSPTSPGTQQTMTVSGLAANTVYHFALKSMDDVGNISLLSNVATAETLDGIAPAAITDLSGAPASSNVAVKQSPLIAISSSGDLSPDFAKEKTVDSDLDTFWVSTPRTIMQTEQITIDLGAQINVTEVRLRSRADSPGAFPKDFQIQVSDDNVNFTTVHSELDFVAAAATWYLFDIAPLASARYVRIRVTESIKWGTKFAVHLAEIEVYRQDALTDGIQLQWTAPGDDDIVGTAASYDVRYSPNPIQNITDFNNATQVVAGVPTPQPAGSAESMTVPGLGFETVNYFAIRTTDDAGNISSLSNVPKVATLGTPPDPVTDLQVTAATGTSIFLAWTATADDGSTGAPATSYDLRFSTSAINDLNDFAGATPVSIPAPGAPGSSETFEVTGLASDTLFYFALRVVDDADNLSTLSNVTTGATEDAIAPEIVTDLTTAIIPELSPLSLTAISASGQLSAAYSKEKAMDGDLNTLWSSPARPTMQVEQIVFDLGAERNVGRVRLRTRADTGGTFPRDFQIQLSSDNVNFTAVHTESDFVAAAATWYAFDLTPTLGRYVRLHVTESVQWGANFVVQLGEVEVFEQSNGSISATLTWTAPGDNLDQGTATSYDVRFSTSPINTSGEFNSATQANGEPVPAAAGSNETMVLSNLPGESTVHIALKAFDEKGNSSPISNNATVITPGVPPAAVSDLSATSMSDTSIRLDWTAVGNDANTPGTAASSYDIRYSTSPINNDADFGAAAPITIGVPSPPGTQGFSESFVVNGLDPDTQYHFAMKVADEVNNLSSLSNVGSATTDDNVAPNAIADLSASAGATILELRPSTALSSSGQLSSTFAKEKAVDGNGGTFWSTPARLTMQAEQITFDLGSAMNVARVRLLSRSDTGGTFPKDFQIQLSTDNVSFTAAHSENDFVAAAGTFASFDFTATTARYVRIAVTETRRWGSKFIVQIAEAEIYESLPAGLTLSWTATGDNLDQGTASSYDIRFATSPINTGAAFDSATQLNGEPAPQPAGSPETFFAGGLGAFPGETMVYFVIKALDEGGNASPISNNATVITPGVAPAAVSDLTATSLGATSVQLDWTAVGDDGNAVGTAASSYDVRYSTSSIDDDSDFGAATPITVGVPSPPGTQGSAESFVVNGLDPDTQYHFAMKVADEVNNSSPLSNGASATTDDNTPPATISDLSGSTLSNALELRPATALSSSGELSDTYAKEKAADSNGGTFWSTPARPTMQAEQITFDLGAQMNVARVRLLSRSDTGATFPKDFQIQLSTDNVSFTAAHSENDFVAAAGTFASFDFTATTARYVRISVSETRPWGPNFIAQIAEVEVYETVPAGARLTWTAPGDNVNQGTATSYDVRYSTSPISNDTAFNSATQVGSVPAPQQAGSTETLTVTGLGPGTYYFRIKTSDESGNVSGMSNEVTVTIP